MKNIKPLHCDDSSICNLKPVSRRGFVLVLVVIVIALLTLVCFTFSELMLTERKAAIIGGRQAQALAAADSGAQMTRIFLLKDIATQNQAGGWYDNPTQFCGSTVVNDINPAARIKVTIVAPALLNGIPGGGIRYGLENESAKLNINNLLNFDKSAKKSSSGGNSASASGAVSGANSASGAATGAGGSASGAASSSGTASTSGSTSGAASSSSATGAEAILMNLPGMTQDIADSILDWIDTDDQLREYGAESEYYSNLTPPYLPKNGPLSTLEELLLVKGVTPALLFGSDINRNGRIDVDESANVNLPGVDNSDGSMNQGWSPYLTLYSKEKNVQSNGQPKVNLNGSDLQQLSTDLQTAGLSDDQIQFILAYRLYGPDTTATTQDDQKPTSQPSNKNQKAGSTGSNKLDLTKGGSNQLSSILDLIGAQVKIQPQTQPQGQGQGQGQSQPTTLQSPFTNSSGDMTTYLPTLMDCTTVNAAPEIVGRININLAPKAVLMAIPGMTSDIVDDIIARRTMDPKSIDASHGFATWLLSDGLVTLKQMKAMEQYVTCGGDVYRVQAIGYFDDGGVAARIEVILDASTQPATVLFWRDISHLGRGFTLDELGSAPSQ